MTDGYRRLVVGRDDSHYLKASRWSVVGAGLAVALMAMLCIVWHRQSGMNLLGFAFNAVVLTSSGLLGVFLCALLTKRGSWASAIAGMVAAFVATLALQPPISELWLSGSLAHLAWPWRMVIGTAVSVFACALGRARQVAHE